MTTTFRIPSPGRFGAALAAFVLAFCAPLAWAEGPAKNAVESIDFSSIQGGKILVKVGLKDPLTAVPQGFAVTNPPRIAIDLPNTVNGLNKNQVEAGQGDLRSISVVQTATRTRLVMNLSRNLNYTQAIDGQMLIITIEGAQATTTGAAATTSPTGAGTVFAEAPATTGVRYNLRDVDFRRGKRGRGPHRGRPLRQLDMGIDIRQQGRQVLVDFINTNAAAQPRAPPRRGRFRHAGALRRHVPAGREHAHGDRAASGIWEYSAYQTDNQFILEVKPRPGGSRTS